MLLFITLPLFVYSNENSRKLLQYDGSFNSWVIGEPHLPRGTPQQMGSGIGGMMVGYFNDSIYLIGGSNSNKRSLFTYDILSNTFHDYGQNALSNDISYLHAQTYVQINNIVYFIQHPDGDTQELAKYDLSTNQLTLDFKDITATDQLDKAQCVTTMILESIDYVFIIPRYNILPSDSIKILNISSNEWLNVTNTNFLNRANPSCVIHPSNDKLYVIGKSIATMYVGNLYNISNQKWNILSDELILTNGSTDYLAHSRAVIVGSDILVVTGYTGLTEGEKIINVIDTISDTVRADGKLNYPVWSAAVIVVNDIIYAFGGISSGQGISNWQYKHLTPTKEPTTAPTNNPTKYPSKYPTKYPTQNPTKYPSKYPTLHPTMNPSDNAMDMTLVTIIIVLCCIIVVILILLVIIVVILKNKVLNKEIKNNQQKNIQNESNKVINITTDNDEQNELNMNNSTPSNSDEINAIVDTVDTVPTTTGN